MDFFIFLKSFCLLSKVALQIYGRGILEQPETDLEWNVCSKFRVWLRIFNCRNDFFIRATSEPIFVFIWIYDSIHLWFPQNWLIQNLLTVVGINKNTTRCRSSWNYNAQCIMSIKDTWYVMTKKMFEKEDCFNNQFIF